MMKCIARIFILPLIWCLPSIILSAQSSKALKFNHLTVNNGLPQNSVYSIVKDKYGFMWFGTWGGAVRYDGYSSVVYQPIDNDTTSLPDYRISCIVKDALENIWIETENPTYLYQYNYELDNFTRFPNRKAPQEVRHQVRLWHRNLFKTTGNDHYRWQSSNNGLIQTNLKTGEESVYQVNQLNPFSLTDNLLKNAYLDNEDNLWIGTQSGGGNFANLYEKQFFNYSYHGVAGKGLIDNVVRAIAKDRLGRVWVGSENKGITIIEPKNGQLNYSYLTENRLKSLQIRALLCDKNGVMWIGTKAGLFGWENGKIVFDSYNSAVFNDNIYALHEDFEGNLWIGTLYGVVLFNKKANRLVQYRAGEIKTGYYIRDIIEDKNHNLWIASEDGGVTHLIRNTSSPDSITFNATSFRHRDGNRNSLSSDRVYSLALDESGMVWVATDAGVNRINPTDYSIIRFSRTDGLPVNLTMAVMCDNLNQIWVSHKKGLTRINAKTFELQSFEDNDGLVGNGFSQSACFRDTVSGEMYFGGINGLTSFLPEEIKTNPYPPKVVLTNLHVMHQAIEPGKAYDNRIILDKTLLCSDEITLTWWDKTFQIEFAALHFANPSGNKYKYMLEGFDTDWIHSDAQMRLASYANLNSGTYRFKVMAANSDGVWNSEPTLLTINVLPPWWQTFWAYCGYVGVVLGMGWLLHNYLVSRIKLRETEKLSRAKLQFFTELSHEFRTPLTLIVDPLEKLKSGLVEPNTKGRIYDMMHRNAKQLLLLINQLLDFRKLEDGHFSLNLQKGDMVAFVRAAVSAFEVQAEERHILLKVDSTVDNCPMLFDENKLTMVLNNLLSNALKFTPEGGEVTVSMLLSDEEESFFSLSVSDTGVGIAKNELDKIFKIFYQTETPVNTGVGTGIGLALTKELVELLGGTIEVQSEQGKGTSFVVKLPLDSDVQSAECKSDLASEVSETTAEAAISEDRVMLVVDDNADIRQYVEMNFGYAFKVLTAGNGTEGYELAKAQIPDIIISDVMMPDMDGLELCQKLKSNQNTSHIPVVMLTARQSEEAMAEGYETGADAYLTKPFSTAVLKARVDNLLSQRQKLRELFSTGSKEEIEQITHNEADAEFLEKVTALVSENLEETNFDIDLLAEKMGMSRSQFYRKIKALTNKSGNDFIMTFRMNKAVKLLLSGKCNITETAYRVGYNAPTSFTRAFAKYYGVSPKEYLKEKSGKGI